MIHRLDKWCSKSALELFIKQADLATAIQDCHMEINDSLTKLQVCPKYHVLLWLIIPPSSLQH